MYGQLLSRDLLTRGSSASSYIYDAISRLIGHIHFATKETGDRHCFSSPESVYTRNYPSSSSGLSVMEGSGSASGELQPANCTNLTTCDEDDESIDLARTGTLVIIMTLSLIGNIFTIIVVSKFKVRRIPDVLVIGLACTDLVATLIPVPMTLYSYVTLENYHDLTCAFYATVAHFTRYSSLLIVTTVAVERYYAINRPFFYRNHATPKKFVVILIGCWAISFIYAVFPAVHPDTEIDEYDGFCLFDISSRYAISILVYAGIQYVIVFVCFVMVMVELLQVYRRRKQLKVRDDYNRRSRAAGTRDNPRFQRPPSLTTRWG